MSKSLKRVKQNMQALGLDCKIFETKSDTHTAQQAAEDAGCDVAQIVKSVILRGQSSDKAILFLTSGKNQVDIAKAEALAGEPLGKADAAFIRAKTGFAIGGVSPFGHLTPSPTFLDESLRNFEFVWAAAGTPRHNFRISLDDLVRTIQPIIGDFTEH